MLLNTKIPHLYAKSFVAVFGGSSYHGCGLFPMA